MANELPYFPFYPADFLLDEKVEAMTSAQVGCYVLLLCRSWISSEPGYIPTDEVKQARLARVDLADWKLIKDDVLACFKRDNNGRMYQPRLLAEYQKALEAHEARVKGGKNKSARARMRSGSCQADAQHMLSTCSAQAQHEVSRGSACGNRTEQNRTEQNKGKDTREESKPQGDTNADALPVQSGPVQPVEVIRYQPDKHQAEFEQALARWKGTGGKNLSLGEWEIFRRMMMGFGAVIHINGTDKPVYEVAALAVSEAIKQQANYGTASTASKYIAAILERCRRDGVWPGEFASSEKPQRKWTPETLCDALNSGKVTTIDGKPAPAGAWGFNSSGLYLNKVLHIPVADFEKRRFA